jgi:small subunit ribosomal protein S3
MGQKVHPEGLRVGYIHDWKSNWFNERNFADYLHEDTLIREHIIGRLSHAGLSDITIRKNATEVEINIHTARPGIVIGKSGSEVDALRRNLHQITGKQVKVNILEIKRPELDARLVAQSIAEQLQNRVAFRRAMKRALTSAMRSGAKGVKVQVSGRLGGAEMARREGYSDGRVPLHTLRADIDYGFHEARTTFGRIGVKCWINKGEIMPEGYTGADLTSMDEPPPQANDRGGRDGRTGRDGRGGGRGGRGGGAGGAGGPGGSGPGGRGGRGGQGGGGGGRGGFGGGAGGAGGGGRGGQGGGGGGRGGFGGGGAGGGGGGRGGQGGGGGGRGGFGGGGAGGGGGGRGGQGGGGGGRGGQGGGRGPGGSGGGGSRGPRPAGASGGAPSGGGGAR